MSRKKALTYFDMSIEECKQVFNTIEGLVVVDRDSKVKYISPYLAEQLEELYDMKLPENLTGLHIKEFHPITKIENAFLEEKIKEDYVYIVEGMANVARIKPICEDGVILGAIDYDLFADPWSLALFMDKVHELEESGAIHIPKNFEEIKIQYNNIAKRKNTVDRIIGNSPQMRELRKKIYDITESDSTVLIRGETGCGKELVAHAIHNMSKRKGYPIVEINCAAIPETLFESELFGYEEGSFTGAAKGGRKGKFQMAEKGTVFLDEIDQLPYHVQPKLLRVLQEKEIDRIGGEKIPVNVRIIAATNKKLREMVAQGTFREDLYYRLNVVDINIPPLRERKEDIPLLIDMKISQLNGILNCNVEGVSERAMKMIRQYQWPGNVRELFNMIERAMNVQKDGKLDENCFKDLFFNTAINHEELRKDMEKGQVTLDWVVALAEKEAIKKALEICDWNKSKTAEFLNISRPTLHYKIKKYHI